MSVSELIDIDSLRGPLADGSAGGINLRTHEEGRRLWSVIRDLRDEARQIERLADRGDPDVDRSAALTVWRKVAERCGVVLTSYSRDLAVMATLIEALTRTGGFSGLADGCDTARGLVEDHWNELFPIPDPEDGPADERDAALERALPLVRLAGEDSEGLLVPAILHVPLVDGKGGEQFGLCHWRSSRELRGLDDSEKLQTALERGGTSPEQFESAAQGTDRDFLRRAFVEARRARRAWDELAVAIASASADAAVLPTLPIRELCDECEAALQTFAAAAVADLQKEEQASADAPSGAIALSESQRGHPGSAGLTGTASAGGDVSRDDVLRLLQSAADFFERHDPHSLLGAQVRNVVRMARLSREEYYREIVGDPSALQALSRMAGLTFEN